MPRPLREEVESLAARRSTPQQATYARDIYIEALRELFTAIDTGDRVTWLAPERVKGRLMVWLPVEVSGRFRAEAAKRRQSLTVVLLTAVRAYLDREA